MTSELPVNAVASASLWNENGYFWESKNHSPLALAALQSALPTLEVRDSSGPGGSILVRVSGVVTERTRVEASVSLRKGKLMALFDYSLCITWDAFWRSLQSTGGGSSEGVRVASGELSTQNVGPDDVNEEFPVSVKLTQAPSSPTPALAAVVAHAKGLVCGPLSSHLRATLRAMTGWLLTLDSGKASIDADAKRRAEECERERLVAPTPAPPQIPVVREEREEGCGGSAPPPVFETSSSSLPSILLASNAPPRAGPPALSLSASQGDTPLLTAASRMASNVGAVVPLPVAPHRVIAAGAPPEILPSIWNTAGWGYEDKDMTPWAHKHLKAKLAGFDVDVPGGHLKVVEVEVSGEASKILSRVS